MSFIKLFNDIKKDEVALVGGKALSLGRLTQAGLTVPPGFVVPTDVYKTAKDQGIDPELKEAIFKAFDSLGAERVAVRSSAIAEDSADASWAGQFDTFLNVKRNELLESVKKCWDSASSEIVNEYAESKSVSSEQLAIAVVVQKMVESEVSGVVFSVNPITKDENEIMIEATYGLGELLVQGMVTPDNYLVSKTDLQILDKKTPHKSTMLVYQDGDNIERPVPNDIADEACLDDSQILELARLTTEIEDYYGSPQDIEWALENDKFYIVQSRPITTL